MPVLVLVSVAFWFRCGVLRYCGKGGLHLARMNTGLLSYGTFWCGMARSPIFRFRNPMLYPTELHARTTLLYCTRVILIKPLRPGF